MPNLQAWRLGWDCFDDDNGVYEDEDGYYYYVF